MQVDDSGKVLSFTEKPATPSPMPGQPGRSLASMGIYLFNADFLLQEMARDAADPSSSHDFGKNLSPGLVGRGGLYAHDFKRSCVNMVDGRPYWRDVGTVDTYWAANMDLTHVLPELDLYDDAWPILSQQRQLPPAKFVFDDEQRRGLALDSFVSSGCVVSGSTVRRSILFSKVRIGDNSVVEGSLLLPNVVTGQRVQLRNVIIDKHCRLPDDFQAGRDPAADRARGFFQSPGGITLVAPEMLGQRGRVG